MHASDDFPIACDHSNVNKLKLNKTKSQFSGCIGACQGLIRHVFPEGHTLRIAMCQTLWTPWGVGGGKVEEWEEGREEELRFVCKIKTMFKQNKNKRTDIIQNACSIAHSSIRPSCTGGTGGNKVRLILPVLHLNLSLIPSFCLLLYYFLLCVFFVNVLHSKCKTAKKLTRKASIPVFIP